LLDKDSSPEADFALNAKSKESILEGRVEEMAKLLESH
jgi:hypothetical protein